MVKIPWMRGVCCSTETFSLSVTAAKVLYDLNAAESNMYIVNNVRKHIWNIKSIQV